VIGSTKVLAGNPLSKILGIPIGLSQIDTAVGRQPGLILLADDVRDARTQSMQRTCGLKLHSAIASTGDRGEPVDREDFLARLPSKCVRIEISRPAETSLQSFASDCAL
jgi:hypothetical protein